LGNTPLFSELLFRIYFTVFPEVIMHNHTYRLTKFVKSVPRQLKKGDVILDAGCGSMPYRRYFKNYTYIGQDVVETPGLDIVSDITSIPLKANSVDAILCTQVLEHCKTPDKVFKEFGRLLKPGGKLFLSTHHAFPIHMEPHDYYRFTKYGLAELAESNDFVVESIVPQGGIFIVISKLLNIAIPKVLGDSVIVKIIYYALFTIPLFIMNLIFYLLDFLDKKKDITLNYECVFVNNKRAASR